MIVSVAIGAVALWILLQGVIAVLDVLASGAEILNL
jgi:hypothetical protein